MPSWTGDRKSTRLNSSHLGISYAVFCLKKKQELPPRTSISLLSSSLPNPPLGSPVRSRLRDLILHPAVQPLPDLPRGPAPFFFLLKRRPPIFPPFPHAPLFQ